MSHDLKEALIKLGCTVWDDGTVWIPSNVNLPEEINNQLGFGIPTPSISENLFSPLPAPQIYEGELQSL